MHFSHDSITALDAFEHAHTRQHHAMALCNNIVLCTLLTCLLAECKLVLLGGLSVYTLVACLFEKHDPLRSKV